MTDFRASILQGLEAAKRASRAREEISAVFGELNAELLQQFGDLTIQIRSRTKLGDSPFAAIEALKNPKRYSALVLANAKSELGEIAEWKQDPNGYPCWIETTQTSMACENREALVKGLSRLMSSPHVGELILKYSS